jgi:hypothetical protein
MANQKVRAQGVLYTTLVDLLIQILFLLVFLLAPLMIYLEDDKITALNRIYPQIAKFIPKENNINWNDYEMALVPKSIAKAYESDPEALARDLNEVFRNAGLDPKTASLADLKARLSGYKSMEAKATKYDQLVGKPHCSLSLGKDNHQQHAAPLLRVILEPGGLNLRSPSKDATNFLLKRADVNIGTDDWTYFSPSKFSKIFETIESHDDSCKHFVRIEGDDTGQDAKDEYKRMKFLVDRLAYNVDLTLSKATK